VVAELRRPQQAAEAAQAVRRQVQTRHDVPLHTLVWVRPGQVPKTSSGKVRRQECRARYLSGSLQLMEGAE
jgi:acyl-CoA synthetase (AMP-forming)/AMP-acid ligase II